MRPVEAHIRHDLLRRAKPDFKGLGVRLLRVRSAQQLLVTSVWGAEGSEG